MEDSQPAGTAVAEVVDSDGGQWFSVSTQKFILMSVCTLGLYELYWFYKNWQRVRTLEDSTIWPFWRALFSQVMAYFLFKRVRADAEQNSLANSVPAVWLAVLYFLLMGSWRLPDPYGIVGFMTFAPLLVVNEAMTEINRKTVDGFRQNSRIERWNWLAVTLGGVLAAAAIAGAFLPSEI